MKNKILAYKEHLKNPNLIVPCGKNTRENKIKKAKEYPKLIRITIHSHMISIGFNHRLLPWIHKKLKIDLPKKKDSLPGRHVIHDRLVKLRSKITN